MKPNTLSLILFISLFYFAAIAGVNAVVPAPDGGYPGGNTAEGENALLSLTSGNYNTAVGYLSLRSETAGQFNTAIGAGALLANVGNPTQGLGMGNTATGAGSLLSNTLGSANTANGAFALSSNTLGHDNTAIGAQALQDATASNNTAVGFAALFENTSGSENIALGFGAGMNVTTGSNVICIGASGNNVDNSCYIGNIFNATSTNGTAVFVNSNGRLGTSTSSRRFKEGIKPMDHASETLFSLKPVRFRYKKAVDPEGAEGTTQFGLVAEDVEKVNPELVVRDKEGKAYSVRYDQVNAMLLNEFLKEHRKVQQQAATIVQLKTQVQATATRQQKQIEALTAGLQKVSAQLQLSKPAPQTVLNDQ